MKVIISAGGTGGHIYPALAIIDKIKEKEPNSEFLYIGTHDRMEKDIIPAQNIPFKAIEIYGFYRKRIFKNFKTIKAFYKSYKDCKKTIKEFNPDIVIGVGGYVTGPVIYAANKLGYKTFIHEQNSILGKCNRFLSKYATKIGVSFESSINKKIIKKTIYTGNPCSEKAINCVPISKEELGLPNKPLIYIVMGSLGASSITNYLIKTLPLFDNKPYEILFVTGKSSYELIKQNKFPNNVHIVPYIENQVRVMKIADIIVTRCGATTLSEIVAINIPSILIPSPYVPDNHQYKNGLDLVNKNGAIMIEEKELTDNKLIKTIDELLNNPELLVKMRSSLKEISIPNSATKIYDILRQMIDGK